MATAAATNVVMPSQSFDAMSERATIQLPPTASTDGCSRYAAKFCPETPPVGTNFTSANGAASALMAGNAPLMSAGKNLTTSMPNSSAARMSVGVATPGNTGTPAARHQVTTAALTPGDTMNDAPAVTASSACATVNTVPAPTSRSRSRANASIAATAAGVRSVISMRDRSPARTAAPSGRAAAGSSSTTTGSSRSYSRIARTCDTGDVIGLTNRRRPQESFREHSLTPTTQGTQQRQRGRPPDPTGPQVCG